MLKVVFVAECMLPHAELNVLQRKRLLVNTVEKEKSEKIFCQMVFVERQTIDVTNIPKFR